VQAPKQQRRGAHQVEKYDRSHSTTVQPQQTGANASDEDADGSG
jgi:hypothetical protein